VALRIALALLLACIAADARAQRLALRSYDVGDGLAHSVVISLHQDRHGYLWMATYEGLSRFDGYRFTNYGAREGLGHFVVNDITSDRDGRVWAALNGAGVVRLLDDPLGAAPGRPAGVRRFTTYVVERGEQRPANAVNRILFDSDNRMWCSTDGGLYRSRDARITDAGFERVVAGVVPYFNNAAFTDRRGRLWFGIGSQVVQVSGGKLTTSVPARDAEPHLRAIAPWKDIHTIVEDDRGRILAAETTGIYEFVADAGASGGKWRRWQSEMPATQGIRTMIAAAGGLWIGTDAGLIRYNEGVTVHYTTRNGLSSNRVRALLRDSEDNLWISTEGSGVSRLPADGAISYAAGQGLPSPEVYQLAEDRAGRMHAISGCSPPALLRIQDGAVSPLPSDWLSIGRCFKSHLIRDAQGNTWFHTKSFAVQDRRGRWWFHTRRGLEVSAGPDLDARSSRLVGAADGFPEVFYSEIHLDADGALWVVNGLTGNLYAASTLDGTPRFRRVTGGLPLAEFLLRDRAGTLWIASSTRIWRLTKDGALSELPASPGLPAIEPRALFEDHAGRIWIGLRYQGVSMTVNPAAAQPQFVNYTTANGLSSDTVWSIGADDAGRIYLGTGKGLDQLDVGTGRVRHFSPQDGIAGSVIEKIVKDRAGQIWVASDGGLSKLNPAAFRTDSRPPPIFINRVQVAGEEMPLPVSGALRLSGVELPAASNNLTIQFVGLSYRSDKALLYQYRLEGTDTDWSPPAEQREVNFASLAPGRYRFVVRAISSQGLESVEPAAIDFRVVPALYQRGWFFALAALGLATVIFTVHRYRVRRLLELARIRERIATDLHDDIGANLTRIAILSEVAQRGAPGPAAVDGPMPSIARIARETVAAMSDIVWAISPDRDTLHDLTRKMRDHAEDVFETRDVALSLDLPDDHTPVRVGVHLRRDLYLIFKEAVNNAARHSQCSSITVRLRVAGRQLRLEILDDGIGFARSADHGGHGLTSMQRRAERLGAHLELRSAPGHGTAVTVVLPMTEPRADVTATPMGS
jgi:signal transduction histidine kinase/ligand-binding sensor domain-containing protein